MIDLSMLSTGTGAEDDGTYNPNIGNSKGDTVSFPILYNTLLKRMCDQTYLLLCQPSMVDDFSYVMHGRVFSIKHIENERIEVQASFGGLLMRVRGEQKELESFAVDRT